MNMNEIKYPLVSLCLFSYNQEKYIEAAIKGALSQTYSPLEIIISDDCSTDKTFDIIKRLTKDYKGQHKIILNRNETNLGLASHVNHVFQIAKGDFFAITAGDDISLPERIEKIISFFMLDSELAAVSCGLTSIDSTGNVIENAQIKQEGSVIYTIADYLNDINLHVTGASRVIKKTVVEKFGLLNSNCPTEDTTILLRSFIIGKVGLIGENLLLYRTHENNLSGEKNIHKMSVNLIFQQYKKDVKLAVEIGLITNENAKLLFSKINQIRKNRVREKYEYKWRECKLKIKQILKPAKVINLMWYRGKDYTNFGDELSPYIISRIYNVRIVAKENKAKGFLFLNIYRVSNLIIKLKNKIRTQKTSLKIYTPKKHLSIGSIIGYSKPNYNIWGSGIISRTDFIEGGTFYAVRGFKTIARLKELGLKAPSVVGDPALLLPLVYNTKTEKKYKLGIIPHYIDYKLIKNNIVNKDVLIIDFKNCEIEHVIRQILSCETVISSSLHGIIVSHAYDIPALWFKFSNNLFGDDIKFYDYFSSVEIYEYEPFYLNFEKFNIDSIVEIIKSNNSINKINIDIFNLQINLIKSAPFVIKKEIELLLLLGRNC